MLSRPTRPDSEMVILDFLQEDPGARRCRQIADHVAENAGKDHRLENCGNCVDVYIDYSRDRVELYYTWDSPEAPSRTMALTEFLSILSQHIESVGL